MKLGAGLESARSKTTRSSFHHNRLGFLLSHRGVVQKKGALSILAETPERLRAEL